MTVPDAKFIYASKLFDKLFPINLSHIQQPALILRNMQKYIRTLHK